MMKGEVEVVRVAVRGSDTTLPVAFRVEEEPEMLEECIVVICKMMLFGLLLLASLKITSKV